jgi:membrane protein
MCVTQDKQSDNPAAAKSGLRGSLIVRVLKDPDLITAALPGSLPTMIRVGNRARIGSLAAESAFWSVFILPWTLLGAVASISWWQQIAGTNSLLIFHDRLLATLDRVLTPEGVTKYAKPVLDDVLLVDHRGLTVVGLVVALWSGSRLVSSLIAGVRIIHSAAQTEPVQAKSWLRIRTISLLTYTAGLILVGFVMPLLIAVPALLVRWGLSGIGAVSTWVALAALIAVFLVALYLTAIPRKPSRGTIYGALLCVAIGAAGTLGLQTYFSNISRVNIFAAFAAPIAFLLWVYILCLAVMLGAIVDAVVGSSRKEPT